MTGDHHGRTAGRATLLVRTVDEILGTHRRTRKHQGCDGWMILLIPVEPDPL
jgi:hypothetical protein